MKRLSIMGLCVAAVFAFSAMVASGAQAAEYGQCLKINPATGKALKNHALQRRELHDKRI